MFFDSDFLEPFKELIRDVSPPDWPHTYWHYEDEYDYHVENYLTYESIYNPDPQIFKEFAVRIVDAKFSFSVVRLRSMFSSCEHSFETDALTTLALKELFEFGKLFKAENSEITESVHKALIRLEVKIKELFSEFQNEPFSNGTFLSTFTIIRKLEDLTRIYNKGKEIVFSTSFEIFLYAFSGLVRLPLKISWVLKGRKNKNEANYVGIFYFISMLQEHGYISQLVDFTNPKKNIPSSSYQIIINVFAKADGTQFSKAELRDKYRVFKGTREKSIPEIDRMFDLHIDSPTIEK